MVKSTLSSGHAAESEALAYLQRQGLQLLERNWSCRYGELDLVMLEGSTVVFVEVRSRRHEAWGGAIHSIDARKREKLIIAAQSYLQQSTRWSRSPCRFDVVTIQQQSSRRLDWIKNAFDA